MSHFLSRRALVAVGVLPLILPDQAAAKPRHVVLLGDSVFDNKAYVGSAPDVIQQVRALIRAGWTATLCATDGAVISDVAHQLDRMPRDATHLVISVGGNDALREAGLLDASADSVAQVLERLGAAQARFRMEYARMLERVAVRGLPAAVCTIYDPRYPDLLRRRLGAIALSVLNDSITREAFGRGLTLLDLRIMLDDDGDFANPIEPSVQGGKKLAAAIAAFGEGALTNGVIASPARLSRPRC
jgi:hypothetical protein